MTELECYDTYPGNLNIITLSMAGTDGWQMVYLSVLDMSSNVEYSVSGEYWYGNGYGASSRSFTPAII